jgi:hypothetical protein
VDELSEQHGTRLPARNLMQAVTLTVSVSIGVSGLPGVPAVPTPTLPV